MAKGVTLTATDDGEPVVDIISKRELVCLGTWKANKPLKQFTSAVARIHKAHGHTHNFCDLCSDCVESLALDPQSRGCELHNSMFPHVFRKGDPTKDQDYSDVKVSPHLPGHGWKFVRDSSYYLVK